VTATDTARAVLTELIEAGVTDVVIAPGSRNAPLSFAAYDAAAAGLVRLHTRIDERSAGFLALGLTKNGNRAAVICTSGTGVANLHPAVLEAVHAGVPLVAVTADRPARLRGTNANQTTDQLGIFGPLVPTQDATGELDLSRLRPVHVNVPLDEPLLPEDRWRPEIVAGPAPKPVVLALMVRLPTGPRTVVVAGDDAGPQARQLAESGGWPLLAEPSSGSRTGANALRAYRLLLS
jgi:2-succinyl-5-enolpyruvyl-6-hydroxy-3-cyclohexene-1-carboxylate synthase